MMEGSCSKTNLKEKVLDNISFGSSFEGTRAKMWTKVWVKLQCCVREKFLMEVSKHTQSFPNDESGINNIKSEYVVRYNKALRVCETFL